MEFACSVCQYTSIKKSSVTRHINKKISCGPGKKEIIEIPNEVICEYCNKKFTTIANLSRHKKDSCKAKDTAKDEEIRKLKEELRKAKTTTINNNQTINNTINIYINNYEDTCLDKLTDKTYNRIINDSDEVYQIIPRLIKEIHFNPDNPENHNIFLSNRNSNNKHLQVYRNKHWEIEKKDPEIDNLINDKETNLSDWIGEKGEKYPEAVERFNEYLEQKYEDQDLSKQVKEEVERVLYNNRDMIKN
jgi:hypothetical protein